MSDRIDKPLLETVKSGWVGQCSQVDKWEKVLAKKLNNPRVLTLSAGTHGLHLALRLASVRRGDECITTSLTCFATTVPILMQGADPVWADIQADSLNIDPNSIHQRITKYTRAIIVMHWGGYPADLEEIYNMASEYGLFVIEDAAHAYGSTYKDSKIGDCKYSDYCMISTQAIKTLNTGVDGGILCLKSNDDYKQGKLLRWYGIDREQPRCDFRCESDIKSWGYKYAPNDIAATIGLVNIKEVDKNIKIARDNASYYRKQLKDFDGITLLQNATDRESSYWLFTILVENRNEFFRMMGEKGIAVSRVHERNDKHTCMKQFKRELPVLDSVIDKMVAVPVGWWVTRENREYISSVIKGGW